MSSKMKLLAWAVFAVAFSMSTAHVAFAGGDRDLRTHIVQYQCGSESGTFSYEGGAQIQHKMPPVEAKAYWDSTRADHGAGCKVTQVDGRPY